MPDYQCFPLWEASGGAVGNIDPRSLPLSDGLIDRLLRWADAYDRTLDPDDPPASGFADADEARRFRECGAELARQMQDELGPGFRIVMRIL